MSIAQPVVADVLSASSLIVAIIAAFLSLWAADTNAALGVEAEKDPLNRGPQRAALGLAMARITLLAIVAVLTLLVLLPRVVSVLVATSSCVTNPPKNGCAYNDVSGLFLVVTIVLTLLCWTLVRQAVELSAKSREIG